MNKWYRIVSGCTVALCASFLIVSCGSGSGDGNAIDSIDQDVENNDSTSPLIVPPDVLPLETSEGAESGLRGCLNRPLYYNGPHFVATSYDVTHAGFFGTTSHSEQFDLIYTVVAVDEEGVAQVDIETTSATSNGAGGTFTTPYTLDGYTVSPVGALDNNPLVMNYDLDAGESVTQTLGAESEGASGSTRTYTYLGREVMDVNGLQVEVCRVDTEIRNEAELPQFRLQADTSQWYGVGSGLKLKEEGVGNPDSEQDRITTVKVLTFGSINSISLF